MNILFISDFSLKQNIGGAQQSNDIIIKVGKALGYDIVEFNYDTHPAQIIKKFDILISSNLFAIAQRRPDIFAMIVNHPFHVRLEHDSNYYLDNEMRKQLFGSSKINFFLSQLHLQYFKLQYGDYFANTSIVYDPIDTSLFCKTEEQKIYDVVYCGFIHPLKGFNNLVEWANNNQGRRVDVFGWSEDKEALKLLALPENLKLHDPVDKNSVARIFQQSKAVFHMPEIIEPFCRMVGEALLCGCDFIGSRSKIGSVSEYERVGYEEFKSNCNNAANEFWKQIEDKFKNQ